MTTSFIALYGGTHGNLNTADIINWTENYCERGRTSSWVSQYSVRLHTAIAQKKKQAVMTT